jgi:hypothetical protein
MKIATLFHRKFWKTNFKYPVAIVIGLTLVSLSLIAVAALNELPPDKQVYEDRYIEEQSQGNEYPAPKDPSYMPEPGPDFPITTGIIENSDMPPSVEDFILSNSWQGYVGDFLVQVFAGRMESDPFQGKLIVRTDISQDQITIENFLTPTKTGSVRIEIEKDLKLVLKSSNGGLYLFDLVRKIFLPISKINLDIKPGSDPNSINCKNQREIVSVGILSTNEFDALTVDESKVTFEGAKEYHVNNTTGKAIRHEEDLNGDLKTDLVFHFLRVATGLNCSSNAGTLLGETFGGVFIIGTDSIRMLNK